jgi:hypothetical protein
VTHLSLHVASLSVRDVWDLPLWTWRQYVSWQDDHLERFKKHRKAGVICVHCE